MAYSKPSEEFTSLSSSMLNETSPIVQTSEDLLIREGQNDSFGTCFGGESVPVKSISTMFPFNAPFAALEPPAAVKIFVASPLNPNVLTSNEPIQFHSGESIIIAAGSEIFTVAALDPIVIESDRIETLSLREDQDDSLPPTGWTQDPEPAQETSCCFPCRPS